MEVITRHGHNVRNGRLQVWTPVSDTAGITIVLGAPAEGQCPDNRPIVPQPMGSRVLPSSDRLNPRDDAGVKTIALLNIQMIDVGGRIEVDVGNGTFEPSPFH